MTGTAAGGYLTDGATPGPVLSNALNLVDQSLGSMVSALDNRGLLKQTAIIVSAKHGQSPMNLAALNRIKTARSSMRLTRPGIKIIRAETHTPHPWSPLAWTTTECFFG